MRGEFLPVWAETWRDIWAKLAKHPDAPEDLFSELYRELVIACSAPVTPEVLADIVAVPARAKTKFRQVTADRFVNEQALTEFLERAHAVVVDLGGDPLANRYFVLVDAFLTKFSLRYDLRRPFTLHPTLSGVFARMVTELKAVTRADAHLHQLMGDFEEAVRDLRADSSSTRIKTCIQKQVNLVEAIARFYPAVTGTTLGRICDELGVAPNAVWPHDNVRDAMKNLYKFASDYPGIRHSGTPANARRDIDMRDMVAISILLAGFTPYLSHQVDSNIIYRG
ncbi:MAG TPA: hypothetical protein VIF40_03255 [Methylosinus sp.]|jgi:hypothetical protein|uniref:hypothetical protein n=1 Tax=Methylosinus sp. TaxID=427 RepID=UPI002F937CC8